MLTPPRDSFLLLKKLPGRAAEICLPCRLCAGGYLLFSRADLSGRGCGRRVAANIGYDFPMTDMLSILLLLLLGAAGWAWFDSLRSLEVARKAGKRACNIAQVQFLDDTVAGIALALVRNESGRRTLRRTYRFEFSDTGDSRLEGRVILLGDRVESVTMEPYQVRDGDSGRDVHEHLH